MYTVLTFQVVAVRVQSRNIKPNDLLGLINGRLFIATTIPNRKKIFIGI